MVLLKKNAEIAIKLKLLLLIQVVNFFLVMVVDRQIFLLRAIVLD